MLDYNGGRPDLLGSSSKALGDLLGRAEAVCRSLREFRAYCPPSEVILIERLKVALEQATGREIEEIL